MTVSITEFITARLAEDEQQALAASPGPWRLTAEHDEVIAADDIEVCTAFALSSNQLRNTARHIARHDPARVLREVAAKRAILTDHLEDHIDHDCADHLTSLRSEHSGCYTVGQLAAVHADHPDYNPKWSTE